MIEIINKIKNSKDAKILIENFVSLSAIQVIGMMLPLITLPYILRVLGFENYGIVAIANALCAYFATITDYSFKITATREASIHRNNQKSLNIIYSKVTIIRFGLAIISLFIINLIAKFYTPFNENNLIFIIVSFSLIGKVLFPEWFFQGIEKMKFISYTNISIQIIYTTLIFILIKSETDIIKYVLLITGASILNGVIAQAILYIKFKIRFVNISIKRIKGVMKKNYPIFINQLLPLLYNNSATFVLTFFVSDTLIGVFSATRKLTDISASLLNVFSRVFFPFLSRRKDSFTSYKKLLLSLTIAGIVILIALYPLLFWALNITNEYAVLVHIIMAISLIGYALYDIYGLNYLIVRNQDKIVMKNTIQMSIIGLILVVPLEYNFGIVGAALIILITRLLLGLGVLYKSIKYEKYLQNN